MSPPSLVSLTPQSKYILKQGQVHSAQHGQSTHHEWDINDPDIPAKVHLYVSTFNF